MLFNDDIYVVPVDQNVVLANVAKEKAWIIGRGVCC